MTQCSLCVLAAGRPPSPVSLTGDEVCTPSAGGAPQVLAQQMRA